MLVLRRRAGEQLVIDNNIVVTVTKITGNRVTLGIEAPPAVRILRGELEEFDVVQSSHSVQEMEATNSATQSI